MSSTKTLIRFFTIADYEEEEIWLTDQHKKGWRLIKMIVPCFYIFEKCTPENVAYRLDYKNSLDENGYFQIFKDYGWEYIGQCFGWMYFRKPYSETDPEQDGEIFSDNRTRFDLVNRVIKTRFLPVLVIFSGCVVPNLIRTVEANDPASAVFTASFSALALFFLYLIVYCGLKLRRLRKKYRDI